MSSSSQQNSDSIRNDSEDFRKVPNSAEEFGNAPKHSEAFRTVPNDAEARESHTLTVKEVARMFENAGVARTERSVVNWCQRDAAGSSRLDSYFDPNERKHFITPESVDRAINEELAKLKGFSEETVGRREGTAAHVGAAPKEMARLKEKIQDLEVDLRLKSGLIRHFQEERQGLLDRMENSSRLIGRLEAEVRLLEGPARPAVVERVGTAERSQEDARLEPNDPSVGFETGAESV